MYATFHVEVSASLPLKINWHLNACACAIYESTAAVSCMVEGPIIQHHGWQEEEQQQHQWKTFDHGGASYTHRNPPLPLLRIPEPFGPDSAADDRCAEDDADGYCTEPSPLFPHDVAGEGAGVLPTPRNISGNGDAQVGVLGASVCAGFIFLLSTSSVHWCANFFSSISSRLFQIAVTFLLPLPMNWHVPGGSSSCVASVRCGPSLDLCFVAVISLPCSLDGTIIFWGVQPSGAWFVAAVVSAPPVLSLLPSSPPCLAFAVCRSCAVPLKLPGSTGLDDETDADGDVIVLARCSELVLFDASSHQHLRTLQMHGRVTAMIVVHAIPVGSCDVVDAAADDDCSIIDGSACNVIIAMDDGEGGGTLAVLQQISGIEGAGRRWGLDERQVIRPLLGGGGERGRVYITCMCSGTSCIGCGCRYKMLFCKIDELVT
jgi:hypothetical protein